MRTRRKAAVVGVSAAWALAGSHAMAQDAVELARVEITGRHYDNAVGTTDAASEGTIRAELLKSRPALRPGEVLEFVPGVIVTQHSGDGTANRPLIHPEQLGRRGGGQQRLRRRLRIIPARGSFPLRHAISI